MKFSDASDQSRVLVLLTDAFGGSGGIAKFNRDLLTALCATPSISEVTVVPRLMPNASEPVPPKLHTVSAALGGKAHYLRALVHTALAFRRSRSKRMIICAHINLLPAAVLASWICRAPVHLVIHGIDAWQPPPSALIRRAIRKIASFIAVSSLTKDRFLSWSGLPEERGVVLPNSIDLQRFTPGPSSPDLIARYGLGEDKVLMTLGRLSASERYKGVDEVLEVLGRVRQLSGAVTYLIVGEGGDRPRLVAKARSLQYEVLDLPAGEGLSPRIQSARPRVIFTGAIGEAEKVDYYRLAHLYVMPSTGEGFGIVFLEALACGIPAIGSKADGSRDALRDGLLGQLVDPKSPDEICDAIVRALSGEATPPPRGEVEYFSTARFNERVRGIVDAIAAR